MKEVSREGRVDKSELPEGKSYPTVMYIRPGPYRWYDVATGMVTTELVTVFLIFPRIGWTCRIGNFRGFKRLLATGCMRCVDRTGLKSERTSERLGRRGSK